MSAPMQEWECMVRVDAYARVTVWADTEEEALEAAGDAWDYSDLDASDVEVEYARLVPRHEAQA